MLVSMAAHKWVCLAYEARHTFDSQKMKTSPVMPLGLSGIDKLNLSNAHVVASPSRRTDIVIFLAKFQGPAGPPDSELLGVRQ